MYLAVGRVQVTVTVAEQIEDHRRDAPALSRPDAVEKAYARAQLQRAVEADRARWERTIQLSGRGHL